MTRYLLMIERDDGWCDWVHPLPGYKMKCCDCALIHDMEFDHDDSNGNIIFRARRNKRATAAARRGRNRGKAAT